MGRKISFIENGKKALKNTPRLCFYHQILMPLPEIFKQQHRTLLKQNMKDMILSGEWMK